MLQSYSVLHGTRHSSLPSSAVTASRPLAMKKMTASGGDGDGHWRGVAGLSSPVFQTLCRSFLLKAATPAPLAPGTA